MQLLTRSLQQQARLVVLQGAFQQPGLQTGAVQRLPFAIAQVAQHELQVLAARSCPFAIAGQRVRRDAQLLADKGGHRCRDLLEPVFGQVAHQAHQSQLHGAAQAVAVAALTLDEFAVCPRQVKVLAQLRFAEYGGYLLVALAFGGGEKGGNHALGRGSKSHSFLAQAPTHPAARRAAQKQGPESRARNK